MNTFTLDLNVRTEVGLSPATTTGAGDVDGSAIDTRGWAWALVAIQFGAVSDTSTCVIQFQDSDTTTGGDFADVTDAAYTCVANADDNLVKSFLVRLHGRKRYGRVQATVGGTSISVVRAVQVILLGSCDTEHLAENVASVIL